jgi:hypothetical protein
MQLRIKTQKPNKINALACFFLIYFDVITSQYKTC